MSKNRSILLQEVLRHLDLDEEDESDEEEVSVEAEKSFDVVKDSMNDSQDSVLAPSRAYSRRQNEFERWWNRSKVGLCSCSFAIVFADFNVK